MADIFLSYTEADREQARRLAAVFEAVGWSVWWDRRIPAGKTWRAVLDKALQEMRCMVVLWSARSVDSEWVYEEASEGRRLERLVPVLLEAVRPPAGFREVQAADLTGWNGGRDSEGMHLLIADLEALLGKPVVAPQDAPEPDPDHQEGNPRPGWLAPAAAGALLLAAGAIYLSLPRANRPPAPATEQTTPQTTPPLPPASTAPPVVPLPGQNAPTPSIPPRISAMTTPAAPAPKASTLQALGRSTVRDTGTPRATARCADLLARIQLGETLSETSRSFYQKECQ